jgi:hypothetical protein
MHRRAAPTADLPILTFMLIAIAFVGALAATLTWLQQPTVLNAVLEEPKAPRAPTLFLPTSNALAIELEERSNRVADETNAELGLQRPRLARSEPQPIATPVANAEPTAKAAKAKSKPRQVRKQNPYQQDRAVAERRPAQQQDPRAFGAFWNGGPRSFFY